MTLVLAATSFFPLFQSVRQTVIGATAVRFYDDIVYDREYNGLVLDDDEGQMRQTVMQLFACLLLLPLGLPLQYDALNVRVGQSM